MWMCLEWVGLTAFAVETRERESVSELLRSSSRARESVGEMFSSFSSLDLFGSPSLPSLSKWSIVQEDSWSGWKWSIASFHPPICCLSPFEGHYKRRRSLCSRSISVCLSRRSFALGFTRRRHKVSVSFLLVVSFYIIAIFLSFPSRLLLLIVVVTTISLPIVGNCISFFALSSPPFLMMIPVCVMCQDVDTSCGERWCYIIIVISNLCCCCRKDEGRKSVFFSSSLFLGCPGLVAHFLSDCYMNLLPTLLSLPVNLLL